MRICDWGSDVCPSDRFPVRIAQALLYEAPRMSERKVGDFGLYVPFRPFGMERYRLGRFLFHVFRSGVRDPDYLVPFLLALSSEAFLYGIYLAFYALEPLRILFVPRQIGERRGGKECVVTGRSRWSPYH